VKTQKDQQRFFNQYQEDAVMINWHYGIPILKLQSHHWMKSSTYKRK
jgi:hypothetical protein